jgi:hypothetical protein
MEKIVCPECGALSFRGFLTYPVCHQCHENLTKCGYCRHFPGDGRPCLRFDPESAVHPSSVRKCGQFDPVQPGQARPGRSQPLRAAVWASILICTVFGLLTVAASLLTVTVEETHNVQVSGDLPLTARVGEEFTALLTIHNDADVLTERLKIRAANELFRRFQCRQVSPADDFLSSGNYRYYSLPELPPKGTLEVAVVLSPLTYGQHELCFEVLSLSNQQQGRLKRVLKVLPGVTVRRPGPLSESAFAWDDRAAALSTRLLLVHSRTSGRRSHPAGPGATGAGLVQAEGGVICRPKTSSRQ